jgi:hypothetical protein
MNHTRSWPLNLIASLVIFCGMQTMAAQVTLLWDAPSENTDDSPLADLAGFKVHIGGQSGSYSLSQDVGTQTSATISQLADGATHYFAISAYNQDGSESDRSAELRWTPTAPLPLLEISAISSRFGRAGGSHSFDVAANSSWSAIANEPWVQITAGPAGNGDGSIAYQVERFTGVASRTATITVTSEAGSQTHTVQQAGDIDPIDYDGDGRSDLAVYWPRKGNWYISLSSGGRGDQQFGWKASRPVPGDYDGDGIGDVAVYWPEESRWYIRLSGGGTTEKQFGWAESKPVPGDYDGDGITDMAVYSPDGGRWFIAQSSGEEVEHQLGGAAATPVPGDYDGDGITDLAVYWPEGAKWYIKLSSGGRADVTFGAPGDIPVPADYDGDGKTDVAVFRPKGGEWFIAYSSGDPATTVQQFGWNKTTPVNSTVRH